MVKDDETVIQQRIQRLGEHDRRRTQRLATAILIRRSSGRKIIAILEKNPKKDPSKYDDEDLQHMRKVVSYNKRHLAQEGKAKQDPDSRSARSLKNWGHDPQKS
ncbi:hypothetical protein D0863_08165 [Hortaea werneckii]|uniref:Uncharacterized protein n=1 Tax=Hortaea werneckii TaxID=91943 RepID=A0A3M7DRJ2_HORWE|nr:hypothetical protein D0863_08165 [Hortaea werneckii]